MPSEQFSTAIRGSEGPAVQTNASGTIQTDNYPHGDGFSFDGSTYPEEVNPAAVVQELVVTQSADLVLHITTIQGDEFDIPLAGSVGSFDGWEIDAVEFRDPDGNGDPIAGGWAGE